jgi:hypothetical protein
VPLAPEPPADPPEPPDAEVVPVGVVLPPQEMRNTTAARRARSIRITLG